MRTASVRGYSNISPAHHLGNDLTRRTQTRRAPAPQSAISRCVPQLSVSRRLRSPADYRPRNTAARSTSSSWRSQLATGLGVPRCSRAEKKREVSPVSLRKPFQELVPPEGFADIRYAMRSVQRHMYAGLMLKIRGVVSDIAARARWTSAGPPLRRITS
jgi:hypothetical protein